MVGTLVEELQAEDQPEVHLLSVGTGQTEARQAQLVAVVLMAQQVPTALVAVAGQDPD